MRGRRTVVVVGAAAAVAASSCGGASSGSETRLTRAKYQAEILAVVKDAREPTALYTDLVVEARPRQQCAAGVATLHDQVSVLVDRIALLRPPAQAQRAQDDFIAAARTSIDRIGTVRERVARGNVSCGKELNRELYGMRSTTKAERAITRLERRGYYVLGE